MLTLTVESTVSTAAKPTERVCRLAAMFGLGADDRRTHNLVPRLTLTLAPGRLIFITGPSGGGKSAILRTLRERLTPRDDVRLVEFTAAYDPRPATRPALPEQTPTSLVDLLPGTLEDAVRWLSMAGLGDAFFMLRDPAQLSDGQRYRWNVAQCMARVESLTPGDGGRARALLPVVLIDEFASTLDRLTAAVIARSVRKWVTRSGACLVAATAHDDLLEHLEPDTLVVRGLGEQVEVLEKESTSNIQRSTPNIQPPSGP